MANLLERASVVLTPTAYNNGEALCIKPDDGSGDFQFSRNSAATRVNAQGLVENVQILSSNLVQNPSFSEEGVQEVSNGSFSQEGVQLITNGDFATDSDWVKGAGWSISGGKAISDGTSGNLYQSGIIVTGKQYKIQATVSDYVSGTVQVSAGAVPRGTMSANGTYTFYQTASSTSNFFVISNIFNGSIDNVSVREVGQDWTLGGGWSIAEDKAVAVSGTASKLRQTNTLNGKTCKVTFTVSDYSSGLLQVDFGSTSSASIIANGDYVFYGTYDQNNFEIYKSADFNGSITNISVKEVGMDWILNDWSIGDSLISSGNTSSLLQQSFIYTSTTSIYKSTFRARSVNGASVTLRLYDGGGSNWETFTITSSNFQDFELTRQRAGADRGLSFYNNSNAEIEITNISVIEITTDTNLPRINYENFSYDGSGNIIPNSGCGSWLFEPQSTNLITQSENFSSWNDYKVTLNTTLSPDGNSVLFLDFDNVRMFPTTTISSSTEYTSSIYLKANKVADVKFRNAAGQDTVISLTTNWVRYELTATSTSTSTNALLIDARFSQGLGASGLEIALWGAQIEEQSYATSYIPTSGSTNTRNQDLCNNGGSLATINSTEGVLYAEIAALSDDGTRRYISLNNGTNNYDVRIYFDLNGYISVLSKVAGTTQVFLQSNSYTQTDFNKIAFKFSENDFALWINGVEVATDMSGITSPANTLNELAFFGNNLPFYGKTKALAVWKEALSDSELTALTTI